MRDLSILINAATLKGYLLATKAPKHMVDLSQAIVDAETVRAFQGGRQQEMHIQDVQVPTINVEDVASLVRGKVETLASNDESRFTATETAQGEANDYTAAAEVEEEAESAPVNTGGATKSHAGKGHSRLGVEMLPAIEAALAKATFAEVGIAYGVTGQSIINFLKRHGVDHKKFSKKSKWLENPAPGQYTPKQTEAAAIDDDWPEPKRSEKTAKERICLREFAIAELMANLPDIPDREQANLKREDIPRILKLLGDNNLGVVAQRSGESRQTIDNFLKRYGIDYRQLPRKVSSRTEPPASKPLMKFKTVAIRDSWGNDNEIQVAQPLSVEKDPETGATVTKYPPGYAYGTGPQKNAHVKGGA